MVQAEWFETLRINIRNPPFSRLSPEFRADLVELVECVAYAACRDDDIDEDTFGRIVSGRGVPARLHRLAAAASEDPGAGLAEDDVMTMLMVISAPR